MTNKNTTRDLTPSRAYLFFALLTTAAVILSAVIFAYFSFKGSANENSKDLQKEAKNIEIIISETFDYANQINNHIGQQIAQHGAADLKFILKLFRESDKIKHRNTELFSWSSFDWVDSKNYQSVNSRLGIRDNPPNMSNRQYTLLSPKNPWTLQVSFPTIGDPSGAWVIPAGTGVVDGNEKYLGAIVVGFDINELTTRIASKLKRGTSFIVLDKDLKIVLESSDIMLGKDSNFFKENFDLQNLYEKDGNLKEEIKVGDINFSNYRKFDNYPYLTLTGFDKTFIDQQFATLILPRILELLCLTIFFLVILFLFKTKIVSLLNTERHLRHSLQRANEAKDNLLASIAHDIKNYIFGIHGLSKIILDSKKKTEISTNEDLQIVETISDQSDELMEFVKDLLDNNQLETGEFGLGKIKECYVKSLIEGVVFMNSSLAMRHCVKLKTNIEDDLPKLRCDVRRMKQILTNLITNAVKYSRSETVVTITVKHLKEFNQIYIEIADQGFGMNEEDVKKYLNGSGKDIDKSIISQEKEIDSHGIGMPIVFKLIRLHHGKIEVESESGVGTKVKLYFGLTLLDGILQGLQQEVPVTVKLSGNNIKTVNIRNKSILLVEDNPVNIRVTTKSLEGRGYQIRNVENGQEALAILDKEDFDLILMDGEMPVMNGYDATKAIREGSIFKKFKNYKTIPIVALMSSSDEKTIQRALDSGMNSHVEKSTSRTKLFDVIDEMLKA